MMQAGAFRVFLRNTPTEEYMYIPTAEPWICKPLVMIGTAADDVLEALLRRAPLKVSDVPAMFEVAGANDFVCIAWSMDRASENGRLMRWLFHLCESKLPANVAMHVEPCGCHGAALVKGRSQEGKTACAHLNSFAKLTRDWRAAEALRTHVRGLPTPSTVDVRRAPRPQAHFDWDKRIIDALFQGGEAATFLHRTRKGGQRVKSTFLLDLEAILAVVDVDGLVAYYGNTDDTFLATPKCVHWCCQPGTATERNPLGDPCCATTEDSVAKVAIAVANWILGRCWGVGCESRWTHIERLILRFIVACLPSEALPRALRELHAFWGLDRGMEATLAELCKADPEDFVGRRRLRLLRICKVLCQPKVPLLLAVVFIGDRVANDILNAILGQRKGRCDLLTLSHPDSPVVEAHEELAALLGHWSADNPRLALLAALGANFTDRALRVRARAHFLRENAGLCIYFTHRLSRPPYSLLLTLYDDDFREMADAALADFYSIPLLCLPGLCRKWRRLCRTRAAMGSDIAKMGLWSWAQSTLLGTHYSERSHNQMRTDIAAKGPGKDVIAAGQRMFCKQLRAHHESRGGVTPNLTHLLGLAEEGRRAAQTSAASASSGSQALVPLGAPPPPQPANAHGGSPFFRFHNMRERCWKQLHCPDRPISGEEREALEAKIKEEWASMQRTPGATDVYKDLAKASKRRKTDQQQTAEQHAQTEREKPFRGVWGSSTRKFMPVDASSFAAFVETPEGKTPPQQPFDLREHPDVVQCAPCRLEDTPECAGLVFGCYNNKKNVCRKHVATGYLNIEMTALCTLLSRWVDSLSQDERGELTAPALWLHDNSPARDGEEQGGRDAVVALCDFFLSPKCQYFVVCSLAVEGPSDFFLTVPQPPFRMYLNVGNCRMATWRKALDVMTSDELVYKLLRKSVAWTVRPLRWEMPLDVESLLAMDVVGVDAALVPRKNKPKESKAAPQLSRAEIMRLSRDPLTGRPRSASSGSAPSSGLPPAQPTSINEHEESGGGDEFDEPDIVDGIPKETRDDLESEEGRQSEEEKSNPEESSTDKDDDPPPTTSEPPPPEPPPPAPPTPQDPPPPPPQVDFGVRARKGAAGDWVKIVVPGGFLMWSKRFRACDAHCAGPRRAGQVQDGPYLKQMQALGASDRLVDGG